MLLAALFLSFQPAPVVTAPVPEPAPVRRRVDMTTNEEMGSPSADGFWPARSINPPSSYITPADYPVDALRNGQQGVVRVVLTVGPDGTVKGCEVVTSSGSASLDSATCRLLTTRPQFTPARNAQGQTREDRVRTSVRWVLPAGAIGSVEDLLEMSVVVGADGKTSACEAMRRSGDKVERRSEPGCERSGPSANANAGMRAALDGKGGTIRARTWLLRSPSEPWPTRPEGVTLLGWNLLRLVVDAKGTLLSCEVVSADGKLPMRRCPWALGARLANTNGLTLPAELRAVMQVSAEPANR